MNKDKIAELLDELGFTQGCIVETVVTTRNPNRLPNHAPMGVTRLKPIFLEVKPFKSSATYRNMLNSIDACINISINPELFLASAFKQEHLLDFESLLMGENLSLKNADATLFVKKTHSQDFSEKRGSFLFKVNSVKINRPLPNVFSRGRAMAIECIVHATRIKIFKRTGSLDKAHELIKKVNTCKSVVEKVSTPNSAEIRVVRILEKLILKWSEES